LNTLNLSKYLYFYVLWHVPLDQKLAWHLLFIVWENDGRKWSKFQKHFVYSHLKNIVLFNNQFGLLLCEKYEKKEITWSSMLKSAW